MYVIKALLFAVIVGWVPWTVISMAIVHFFHTGSTATYLTVWVVYASVIVTTLAILTKGGK